MWQPPTAAFAAAVAVARGGDQAAPIARITGSAEPGPRVLTNPNDPGKNWFPHPGRRKRPRLPGDLSAAALVGNRGCMRRTSRVDQHLPRPLAGLTELESAPPRLAAQQVQASAFAEGPDVGSNNEAEMDQAMRIHKSVKADLAILKCSAERCLSRAERDFKRGHWTPDQGLGHRAPACAWRPTGSDRAGAVT